MLGGFGAVLGGYDCVLAAVQWVWDRFSGGVGPGAGGGAGSTSYLSMFG